jgi:hypothetical protein
LADLAPIERSWTVEEQQTCGKGLAEHSAIPARMAELTEAMADNLRVHMQALELDDEPAREEHAVYLRLVEEQRQAAGRLRAVAAEMAAARDLPMGRHDAETMRSPEVGDAFRRFVEARDRLGELLGQLAEGDQR